LNFESSTTSSQSNFPSYEKSPIRASRQPLTSILKKTSSQVINNPFPIQTNRKKVEELGKQRKVNSCSVKRILLFRKK
jgi:hypothetical protein